MPDSFENLYKVRITGYAVVKGERLPITYFKAKYALDTIPTCEIETPVGRSAYGQTIGKISPGMGVLSQIMPFDPVQVFLKFEPFQDKDSPVSAEFPGMPFGQDVKLFDGFIHGPYIARSRGGSAALGYACFGHLGILAGATQFGLGMTIKDTGADTVLNAFMGPRIGATLGTAFRDGLAKHPDDIFLAIKDLMIYIVKILGNTSFFSAQNYRAQVELTSKLTSAPLPAYPFSFNLLSSAPAADDAFKKQFYNHLANCLVDTFYLNWKGHYGSGDLWDVLSTLLPIFFFSMVPRVDDTVVVPFFRGLSTPKGEAWRNIYPNEYWNVVAGKDFSKKDYSYVNQVALYSESNEQDPTKEIYTTPVLGKATLTPLSENTPYGRLVVAEAPDWLVPPRSISGENSKPPAADAANPDRVIKDENEATAKLWAKQKLGDAVASTVLHDTVFGHRSLQFEGRFRTDIAPGSLLYLQTPKERLSAEPGDAFYGHAIAVTLEAGYGQGERHGRAATTISLSGVRTPAEHIGVLKNAPVHPLYLQPFLGCSLLTPA